MPYSGGLVDPYLKTERAKKHLEELRDELRTFYESKPNTLVGEEDPENGLYRVRVQYADPPVKLALIVGDACYCLRSSLDQLVWALAKSSGSPYPENTQFPIILIPPNSDKRKAFERWTAGVPKPAVAIIDSLQPYHAPDAAAVKSHLLARLDLMCKIDKHRRLTVRGCVTDFSGVFPPHLVPHTVFYDGDKMSVPIEFKHEVNLNPETTDEVIFGDTAEGISFKFSDLERIHDFVANRLLPRFTRFF